MKNESKTEETAGQAERDRGVTPNERPQYEPPKLLKRRSVSRVTLFSGGGPMVGGLPAGG